MPLTKPDLFDYENDDFARLRSICICICICRWDEEMPRLAGAKGKKHEGTSPNPLVGVQQH